jgi:hypothetical protein
MFCSAQEVIRVSVNGFLFLKQKVVDIGKWKGSKGQSLLCIIDFDNDMSLTC